MKHALANLSGVAVVTALLLKSGAMCDQCGFGARATSKRWARCKRCGARVARMSMDEAGKALVAGCPKEKT